MKNLSVGLIQHAFDTDRETTIARTVAGIRNAAGQGAHLVVLQELHCGPYFCQTEDPSVFDLAETIPGPATETFGALAKELGIVLVTSLFERRAAGLGIRMGSEQRQVPKSDVEAVGVAQLAAFGVEQRVE